MRVMQELQNFTADALVQHGFSEGEADLLLTAFQLFDSTLLTETPATAAPANVKSEAASKQKQSSSKAPRVQPAPRSQPPPVEARVIVYKDTPTTHYAHNANMETVTPANAMVIQQPTAPRHKEKTATVSMPIAKVKSLDFSSAGSGADAATPHLREVAIQNNWIKRNYGEAAVVDSADDGKKKAAYPSRKQVKKTESEDVKAPAKTRKPKATKKMLEEQRKQELDQLKATIREHERALQREQLKNSKLQRDADRGVTRTIKVTHPAVKAGLPKPAITPTRAEEEVGGASDSQQQQQLDDTAESDAGRADIMASLQHLQELNDAQKVDSSMDENSQDVSLRKRKLPRVIPFSDKSPTTKPCKKKNRKILAPPSPIQSEEGDSLQGVLDSPPHHSTQGHDSPDGIENQTSDEMNRTLRNAHRAEVNSNLGESFAADESMLPCAQKSPVMNLMNMPGFDM